MAAKAPKPKKERKKETKKKTKKKEEKEEKKETKFEIDAKFEIVPATTKKVALLLGIAYPTAEEAESARRGTRTDTTSAVYRDWVRAHLLETKMNYRVIGVAKYSSAEGSSRFLKSSVGERMVGSIKREAKVSHIDFIFGDYIRMLGNYYHKLYHPFLCKMLPRLIRDGLVTSATIIILPHLRATGIASDYISQSLASLEADVTYIDMPQNPLWRITEPAYMDAFPGAMENINNREQLAGTPSSPSSFQSDAPFMVIRISDSAIEKLKRKKLYECPPYE